ncbi:MAG: FixH family protein [Bacteroidota bacterium]
MNWGNKLILVFIGFAGLMTILVYKAVNTRFELVSKEYYQDELRYQDKIDGRANVAAISAIVITSTKENLVLQLPKEMEGLSVKGEVWFYCKTDATKDLRLPLAVDANGKQTIAKEKLLADKYLMKLSWEATDKKYYLEKEIEPAVQ